MKNSIFLFLGFLLIVFTGKAQTAYQHTATPANSSGNATVLDHPLLNGNADAIIFILPVWERTTESYTCGNFAQNVGVKYNEGTKKWAIVNQNLTQSILPNPPMPPKQAFNVLVMPNETANCFSVVCDNTNQSADGHGLMIDHLASNNQPNALLLVTQNYQTTYNNNSQIVYYSNGKWSIANDNYFFPICEGNKSVMPIGAKFNVLVMQKDQVIIPGYSRNTAFLHKATNIPPAINIEYINPHVSLFDAPVHNAFSTDPGILIFATANWGWSQPDRPVGAPIGNQYTDSPLVAWQTRATNKWAVVNATAVPFKEGTLINVLAIKQLK